MLYQPFISYLRVGYLLHLITLMELCLLWLLFYLFPIAHWLTEGNLFLRFLILLPILWSPLFPQLDARSRFQNYKLIKDHLYLYGFQPRILKPFMKSRCQRDAALAAALELGMMQQCKFFFRSKGYCWYHLFPDITLGNPKLLFTKIFWSTTLFAKTYRPKVDFSKMKIHTNQNTRDVVASVC